MGLMRLRLVNPLRKSVPSRPVWVKSIETSGIAAPLAAKAFMISGLHVKKAMSTFSNADGEITCVIWICPANS